MTKLLTIPVMRGVVLVTALLLWVNLSALMSKSVEVSSPLELTGLKPGLAVAEIITEVDAQVSGSLYALGAISSESISFAADLSNISEPGRYSREVVPNVLPGGVKLVSFEPKVIVFDIGEEISKTVPAVIKTTGQVADDYSVENVTIAPNQVTIYGAKKILDSISSAKAYIEIDGRKATFIAPATFVVETSIGQQIQTVRVMPITGQVTVEIKKGAAFRNLGLRPSFSNKLPGGFWVQEVSFEPSVVTVRGSHQQLQDLFFLTTTSINLSGKTDSFYDQVAVDLPHGVEIVGENLIHAHIIVSSSQDTKQLAIVPHYINVTEGFGVTTIDPASIQVVLSGDPEVIKQAGRRDVALNLDLQGALSGTNTISIVETMFETSEGINVVSFSPGSVEVVLSRLE